MPSLLTEIAHTKLDFRFAETNVRIEAPAGVLAVLDATLSHVPRFSPANIAEVMISVTPRDDVWEIRGSQGSLKVLGAHSALPEVAGAVVSSAILDVAKARDLKAVRASVIERDGRALALIGDDWESALTLATHLHGRGWRFLASDNMLLDRVTLNVVPVQKSLYINASSLAQLPAGYRRAVEASPWYGTAQSIAFYAVDPHLAGYGRTWATVTRLFGAVVVDGAITERSALESLDFSNLRSERFATLGIDWSTVPVVDLRIGSFCESCDLIEHWFGVDAS